MPPVSPDQRDRAAFAGYMDTVMLVIESEKSDTAGDPAGERACSKQAKANVTAVLNKTRKTYIPTRGCIKDMLCRRTVLS
jgi:hypothetical protein